MSKKPSPLKQFGYYTKTTSESIKKGEEEKRIEEEERLKKEKEEFLANEEKRKKDERVKIDSLDVDDLDVDDLDVDDLDVEDVDWENSGVNTKPGVINEEDHITTDELQDYDWWRGEGDIIEKLEGKYGKYGFSFKDEDTFFGKNLKDTPFRDGVTVVNDITGEVGVFALPTGLTKGAFDINTSDPVVARSIFSDNQLNHKEGMWKGTEEDIVKWMNTSYGNAEKTKHKEELNDASNAVEAWISDQSNLDKLGSDFENFNALTKPGEEASYNKLQKRLKEEFGKEDGAFGFTMGDKYKNLDERNLEEVIRIAIEKKQVLQTKQEINKVEAEYAQYLTVDNWTSNQVVENGKTVLEAKITQDKDARNLRRLVLEYQELAKGERTPELFAQLKAKEKQMKIARAAVAPWWRKADAQNVTYNGDPISPLDETTPSFTYTSDEMVTTENEINDQVYNHGSSIEQELNKNIEAKYISDKKGQEIVSITINDESVYNEFARFKILPKGKNKHGYIYELPVSLLGEHYETIVKSDGWDMFSGGSAIFSKDYGFDDSGFASPEGHFGSTSKVDEQTFTEKETRKWFQFDEGEYTHESDDKSTKFKRFLKDWRDNRKDVLRKQEVLGNMHFLNIDVGSGGGVGSDIARGAEVFYEGVTSMFGDDPKNLTEDFGIISSRAQNDILESIVNTTSLQMTEDQKERFKRSDTYKVFEGVVGFLPAIAEFAAIELALGAIEVGTGGLASAVALPGMAAGFARFTSKLGKIYKNSKGVRYTEKQIRTIEKATKTTRGSARFEEAIVGGDKAIAAMVVDVEAGVRAANILKGGGTVGKTWTNTGLGHVYHGLFREELKMNLAFGEHYEMGAGAGFYAVGRFMPWFKLGKYNQLNTVIKGSKSMMAGAVSVKAADALHHAIEDAKGNQSVQGWFDEAYGDLDLARSEFIVDAFVFGIIGAKGWVGKGRNGLMPHAIRTTAGLRGLRTDLFQKKEAVEKEIRDAEKLGIEPHQKLLDKRDKANELYQMVNHRVNTIDLVYRWQDPEEAKKMLDEGGGNIREVFKSMGIDVHFKPTNNKSEWADKGAAAELAPRSSGGQWLRIDTNLVKPGKLPHEVVHLVFQHIFKSNPTKAIEFKSMIKDSFKGFTYLEPVKKKFGKFTEDMVGKEVEMSLEEMIENQYGKETKEMKAEEFVAYAAEILANPRHYADLVGKGTWKNLKQDINRFTEEQFGAKLPIIGNNLKTKQDLIDFLGNFAVSVRSGTVTEKQLNMFKKVETEGTFKEGIEANSTTTEKKQEIATDKYMKGTSSKDVKILSAETQSKYDKSVRGKEGVDLKRSIDNLIAPDPKNPRTTVAGKDFDPIIYDMIKGMYKTSIYDDPGKRYELALDMVYDLKGTIGSKNRGLKGIIEEYHQRKDFVENDKFVIFDKEGNKKLTTEQIKSLEKKFNAKTSSQEFIDQAIAEGYKGKQNLTKTVMQTLALRIHKLAEPYLEEGAFISRDDPNFKYEEGEGRVEAVEYEFKSANDRAREAKGVKKIDMTKDLKNPDGEVAFTGRDLVNIRKNTTDILAASEIIDLRSVKIAEKINPETIELIENWLGREPGMAKKDYYDYSKSVIEKNERAIFEGGLPETRDMSTSETTNIGKTWAKSLYKEVGEFTFKELKGIAGKILTPSQKAEGRIKMEKVPYKKGILTDLIFKGRKDEHQKRITTLIPHIAFSVTNKVLRNQLENPRFAAMLKAKNPGIYEGLQFENVLNNVKENIRGTVPKSVSSKDVTLITEEYASRIRKGEESRAAMLEIIAKTPELEPYSDWILGQMNLDLQQYKTHGTLLQGVGKGRVAVGITKRAQLEPLEFAEGFKDVNNLILKKAKEYGIDPTLVNLETGKSYLNIHEKKSLRELDPIFSKQFAQKFLPEFWNTFSADVFGKKNIKWAKKMIGNTSGMGGERWGYRELVFHSTSTKIKGYKYNKTTEKYEGLRHKVMDKTFRDGLVLGTKGNAKEKLPADQRFVRAIDNTMAQRKTDNLLLDIETNKTYDLATEKGREGYGNAFKESISPDKTVKGYHKMVKENQKMLKYVSTKLFEYVENARNSGKEGSLEEAINNVSYFLQMQTNLGGGMFRGLATHTAIPLNRSTQFHLALAKRYRSEHELQMANFSGNLLHNILSSSGNKKLFKENLEPSIIEFKQSIISKKLQEVIDANGNTTGIYAGKKGVNWDSPAKGNFLLNREIMESMLDLKTNKTYAELFDSYLNAAPGMKALEAAATKALETKFKATGLSSKKVNLSKTGVVRRMEMIDKAMVEGRKGKKKRKGMSTWDFDDTLAKTKSGVRYTLPNPSGKPSPGKKVIFMAGSAGAGKSSVIKKLGLEEQGFKLVNQDISLEWLSKNSGLPKDMRDFTPEQASKWGSLQWEARDIAQRKQMKFQGKGDGIIVDGTGASSVSMGAQVMKFRNAGYDVQMMFVETSLNVALARNKARKERSLKDFIVERNHKSVMGNKKGFQELFGERFAEVNTDNLKMKDAMPPELIKKLDAFTKGYIKGRLNAGEYAGKGAELKEQGAEFDFSEFNVVKEGEQGPFFQKALDRAKKFGLKDQFVLTARPPESAVPIYEFLKSQGLEIPLENITGLGNSTGKAKAMWMLEKFSEGYNDMYFADDMMGNVKAVKDVLDQLDIKSKVQQARSSKRVKLSNDFNGILEQSTGVGGEKSYSVAKGQEMGRTGGKRTMGGWGSEDLMGLVTYAFAGKGKQGESHIEFFKENLHRPFNRAYLDMHTMKQTISEDYKALRKEMPDIANKLNEKIPGSVYTYDTAVRVDRWTKAGFEIPGLSKTDHKNLLEVVAKDLELQGFSENLAAISKRKEGWIAPKEYWLGETVTADLNNVVDKVYRKEVLTEFVENREAIFGKWKDGKLVGENMNKIESIYGPKHKEALENMLWRMETGSNRPRGTDSNTNRWMNWVNNSVGAIMFFNQKSAALQTISSANYVNGKENNPLAAARAFANLPQYCKDFSKIFNSDMLKQRRAGLSINVEASELISALDGKSNKAQRALAYLLQKGFIPTKYADSFAIASGGATFFRNRIRMYKKQGLSEKEAEKTAWEDFTELTEETQQSSRPDLISMQQASGLGRPILAFANTPMQMFRRHKRRVQDIASNRGDMKENVMSALYYGFAQTIVFSYLTNAMFAVDEESEDPKDIAFAEKKNSRHIHTIADSYFRGMGTSGAAFSAIKNGIVRFAAEQNKGRNADYGNVVIDMLNVSPPIGSKARKLYSAGKTYKYNRDVIPEMGLKLNNPAVLAVANVISALTNIPTDRAVMKAQNLKDANNSDFENWQRISMFMGLNKWALGLEDKELEEVKEIVKGKKKIESKQKQNLKQQKKLEEIQRVIDEEVKEEIKRNKTEFIRDPKCSGASSKGTRCTISVGSIGDRCTIHEKVEQNTTGEKTQCGASRGIGKGPCKMMTSNKSGYCYYHD